MTAERRGIQCSDRGATCPPFSSPRSNLLQALQPPVRPQAFTSFCCISGFLTACPVIVSGTPSDTRGNAIHDLFRLLLVREFVPKVHLGLD